MELERIRDDPRLGEIARIAADRGRAARAEAPSRGTEPDHRALGPGGGRPVRRSMAYAARKFLQLPLLNQNGRWLMRFRGKRVEFVDRRSALREAILEAFEHSRNGTPTQVVCIDDHLAIEIVWTYGVDPDARRSRRHCATAGPQTLGRRPGGGPPARPACRRIEHRTVAGAARQKPENCLR